MTFTWSLQPDMTIICPIALLLTNVTVVLVDTVIMIKPRQQRQRHDITADVQGLFYSLNYKSNVISGIPNAAQASKKCLKRALQGHANRTSNKSMRTPPII